MRRITVPTVQAGHAIGVDLGGTKILAGVVARDGSVVRRHERPAPQDSQEHVLAELEAAVAELLDDSVAAVGFGAPSPIDQARGVVVRCVNLPLENAPLRDRMHERFGLPVGLDNDANAAAIGEWRAGAGRGEDDLVMLTLGTGVGGGVISGGRPFRGRNGLGAELGHVVIVHGGRPCQGACTGHGHLEAYVSGSAATAAARETFGPSADAHRLVRLANEGDGKAKELLEEVGRLPRLRHRLVRQRLRAPARRPRRRLRRRGLRLPARAGRGGRAAGGARADAQRRSARRRPSSAPPPA